MNKLNRKLKREQRVRRKRRVQFVFGLLKRIFLFILIPAAVGSLIAFIERGYLAVGGEAFFPLLGMIWVIYLYFNPYHEN